MEGKYPHISIQCDWNEIIKLPKCEAWISSKYLHQNSVHGKLQTLINPADGKLKINVSEEYQYVSHTSLTLVLKHIPSDMKVVFVAPTKAHKVHNKAIISASVAENSLAVTSSEDDKVLVWDSRNGEILLNLSGHGGPVYKCRFFPSGVVILTGGADGSAKIWSAETGINPVTLIGHSMAITDINIIDKGRNVVTVSRDGSVKLWDVGESKCLATLMEGRGSINCCTTALVEREVLVGNEREIGTGNKMLIVGCESGFVIFYHIAMREEIFSKLFNSAINCCTTIEHQAVIGCQDGKVILMSIIDGRELKVWHESASPVISIITLPQLMVGVGRQDGTFSIMTLAPGYESVRIFLTGSDCDGIRDISFNGKWLFAACRDSNIRKYDFNKIFVHFK